MSVMNIISSIIKKIITLTALVLTINIFLISCNEVRDDDPELGIKIEGKFHLLGSEIVFNNVVIIGNTSAETKTMEIINIGEGNAYITLEASGAFMVGGTCAEGYVEEGDSCILKFKFAPSTSGRHADRVILKSSRYIDGELKQDFSIPISISATAIDPYQYPDTDTTLRFDIQMSVATTPDDNNWQNVSSQGYSAIFDDTKIGEISQKFLYIRVRNQSTRVAAYQKTFVGDASFYASTTTCTGALEPDASCVYKIAFAPDLPKVMAGRFLITSGGYGGYFILRGNAIAVEPDLSAGSALELSLGSFGEPEVEVGSSFGTRYITVKNVSSRDVKLSITPPEKRWIFHFTSDCPKTLISGLTCKLGVKFYPKVLEQYTDEIKINDATIPLKINTTAPLAIDNKTDVADLSMSTNFHDFGEVEVGVNSVSAKIKLKSRNTGNIVVDLKLPSDSFFVDDAISTCAITRNSERTIVTVTPDDCILAYVFKPVIAGTVTEVARLTIPNSPIRSAAIRLTGTGVLYNKPASIVSPKTVATELKPHTYRKNVRYYNNTGMVKKFVKLDIKPSQVFSTGSRIPLQINEGSMDISEETCSKNILPKSFCEVTVDITVKSAVSVVGMVEMTDEESAIQPLLVMASGASDTLLALANWDGMGGYDKRDGAASVSIGSKVYLFFGSENYADNAAVLYDPASNIYRKLQTSGTMPNMELTFDFENERQPGALPDPKNPNGYISSTPVLTFDGKIYVIGNHLLQRDNYWVRSSSTTTKIYMLDPSDTRFAPDGHWSSFTAWDAGSSYALGQKVMAFIDKNELFIFAAGGSDRGACNGGVKDWLIYNLIDEKVTATFTGSNIPDIGGGGNMIAANAYYKNEKIKRFYIDAATQTACSDQHIESPNGNSKSNGAFWVYDLNIEGTVANPRGSWIQLNTSEHINFFKTRAGEQRYNDLFRAGNTAVQVKDKIYFVGNASFTTDNKFSKPVFAVLDPNDRISPYGSITSLRYYTENVAVGNNIKQSINPVASRGEPFNGIAMNINDNLWIGAFNLFYIYFE